MVNPLGQGDRNGEPDRGESEGALATPGLNGDGGTLYLRVAPGGSRSWIQRLTVNGKRRDIGLGG